MKWTLYGAETNKDNNRKINLPNIGSINDLRNCKFNPISVTVKNRFERRPSRQIDKVLQGCRWNIKFRRINYLHCLSRYDLVFESEKEANQLYIMITQLCITHWANPLLIGKLRYLPKILPIRML